MEFIKKYWWILALGLLTILYFADLSNKSRQYCLNNCEYRQTQSYWIWRGNEGINGKRFSKQQECLDYCNTVKATKY